jgi:hypothetical protein
MNYFLYFYYQHKKDLSDAVRRINPASVNTAPNVFWDVEGSLKTVSCILYLALLFSIVKILLVGN